jgi:hypothetical protein
MWVVIRRNKSAARLFDVVMCFYTHDEAVSETRPVCGRENAAWAAAAFLA